MDMMNRLDRLFKDKLADYERPLTGDAWSRLEGNLNKKTRTSVWVRVAALFVIACLVGIAGTEVFRSEPGLSTLPQKNVAPIQQPSQPAMSVVQQDSASEDNAEPEQEVETVYEHPPIAEGKTIEPLDEDSFQTMEESAMQELLTITNGTVDRQTFRKPIVLVYKLDRVPGKDSSSLAVAQALEKKSGLQKAVDFVILLKNGEGPLSGWSSRKDELFSGEKNVDE